VQAFDRRHSRASHELRHIRDDLDFGTPLVTASHALQRFHALAKLAKKDASAAGCKVDAMTYSLEIERGPESGSQFISGRNPVGIDTQVLDELTTFFWSWAALPLAGTANAEGS
jgi:hypothetical protein